MFDFYHRSQVCNLPERVNLQNSHRLFRSLFEDFRLCSLYDNVNYGGSHVCKPLFGSSVATCRLACSEISLSITEKQLERSPANGRTQSNLADSVTALAQLYALYSDRARSFNQWQRTLYPKFKHSESFWNNPKHPKRSTIAKIVKKYKYLQPTIDQFASLGTFWCTTKYFLILSFMQNCCPAIKRGR